MSSDAQAGDCVAVCVSVSPVGEGTEREPLWPVETTQRYARLTDEVMMREAERIAEGASET